MSQRYVFLFLLCFELGFSETHFKKFFQLEFCLTDSIFSHTYLQRVVSERTKAGGRGRMLPYAGRSSVEVDVSSCPGSPTMSLATGQQPTCPTSVLLLVMHAGSVLGVFCWSSVPF